MPSPNRSPLALQPLDVQQPHQRLRGQLQNILPLPRHALFHVCLQIHSLFNVPLIRGEFGVKWKFQNVHAVSPSAEYLSSRKGSGILALAKNLRQDSLSTVRGRGKGKGKGKEVDVREKTHDSVEDRIQDENGEEDMDDDGSDTEEGTISSSDRPDAFNLSVAHSGSSHSGHSAPKSRSGNYSSSSSLPSPVSSHPAFEAYSPPKLASGRATPDMPEPGAGLPAIARGRTTFKELVRHNVKWEKTVNVAVQMTVQKDTFDLLPSELKLVVMQRVIPGDVDSPSKPRIGTVHLNLAEYVNMGAVSRRYLLEDCKFNATLQMTIQLFHIGGEPKFVPPPLHRSEIMAGVEDILRRDSKEHLKKPQWFHASYLRPPENNEGLEGPDGLNKSDKNENEISLAEINDFIPSLPPKMLTSLHTTDNIIEAIFNPVPTSSPAPSPFTYYSAEHMHPRIDISEPTPEEEEAEGANGDTDAPNKKPQPKRWWRKFGPNRRSSSQSTQSNSSSSQISNRRVSDRDNAQQEPETVSLAEDKLDRDVEPKKSS